MNGLQPGDMLAAVSVAVNTAVLWKLWEFTMRTEQRITALETDVRHLLKIIPGMKKE